VSSVNSAEVSKKLTRESNFKFTGLGGFIYQCNEIRKFRNMEE
jgi:hypothetical protein